MAGVTDLGVSSHSAKELGADVMVTEFVSAEGIIQADERTRKYTEFEEEQRPVGDPVVRGRWRNEWRKRPARSSTGSSPSLSILILVVPVKKVVSKNGGSSLVAGLPGSRRGSFGRLLQRSGSIPVTAKIRIGWDTHSIQCAARLSKLLEDARASRAIAIHGRTRAQGYSGEADWEVIDQCAQAVGIAVIGNGDITGGEDVAKRKETTAVAGVMIGRAAMQYPWVFGKRNPISNRATTTQSQS